MYTKIGSGEALKIADCDPAANSFTVHLPINAGSRDAYVLSYRADIVERQAGGYGNSVRFEGGSVRLGGTKQNSAPVSGGGGGGGGGVASRRVGITVTQTDSKTDKPLAGVTYTLYRWDQDNNRRGLPVAQGITDAQGRITFRVKPGAVYELVQTGAASGYDSVPGWEELPEGITEGGGLLITAGAAGSERKLALTNKVDDTKKPDGSGGTGDTGSSGGTGDSGSTGGLGGSGGEGDAGNSGGTDGSGSPGNADGSDHMGEKGYADGLGGSGIARRDGVSGNISEHILTEKEASGLTKPSGSHPGRKAGGAQTGDGISWLAKLAFLTGTASAAGLILLFIWHKKSKERQ